MAKLHGMLFKENNWLATQFELYEANNFNSKFPALKPAMLAGDKAPTTVTYPAVK